MSPSTKTLFDQGRKILSGPSHYSSDEKLLECFGNILLMREHIRERLEDMDDAEQVRDFVALEKECSRVFHRRLVKSGQHTVLSSALAEKKWTQLEREITLAMALSEISNKGPVRFLREAEVASIAEALEKDRSLGLSVWRALNPKRRLVQSKLIEVNHRGYPAEPEPRISASLMERIIQPQSGDPDSWAVKNYEEFLGKCSILICYIAQHSEQVLRGVQRGDPEDSDIEKSLRQMSRQYELFCNTLTAHESWPLHRALEGLSRMENLMVLLLLGKELGYLEPGDTVFTGRGLAYGACANVSQYRRVLRRLGYNARLRRQKIIDVCGGLPGPLSAEDDSTIEQFELELTDGFLEKIKVRRKRKSDESARAPLMRLNQMVLPESVSFAIDTALAQARNQDLIFNTWGLGEVMSYGKGVTLLFSGPPGTGKTSVAEGIAHALDSQIIVANYAEIQNMFVGQTEKKIGRCFHQAREAKAVLFWDEADAMFYDRDMARAAWEVREVNVLLQEIERFQGVCILATNRKASLDKALERRITMKVEFPRPDRATRLKIWKKLLPKKMPLGEDVDLAGLARSNLSGGEIKNVVLNTARIAARRGPKTQATMQDFLHAIQMEKDSQSKSGRGIGFG